MKKVILFVVFFITNFYQSEAQMSPCLVQNNSYPLKANETSSVSDTLTFTQFTAGTNMNTQYLNKGVVFSGYGGSSDPLVYDYGSSSYGKVLISDNWYNPLRINFTDTINPSIYNPASRIEFDNVAGEIDYMSINVYNNMNVLIYHYLSTGPERVILNFVTPVAAYITIEDSANTAFVVDNIVVDRGFPTGISNNLANEVKVYPNPFSNDLSIITSNNELTTLIFYDLLGKKIFHQTPISSQTINTNSFEKGVYFYELHNNQGIIAKGKVIKQ